MNDNAEGGSTRLVVDVRLDTAGRPFGSIHVGERAGDERFHDWLALLRLLEACIAEAPRTGPPTGEP